MSFRRSKSEVHAIRQWHEFVNRNDDLIEQAGLSLAIVADERHWLYFLEHGTLFPENDFFIVGILDEVQMSALIELTARYFESFDREYFDPIGFWHADHWATLRTRLNQPIPRVD